MTLQALLVGVLETGALGALVGALVGAVLGLTGAGGGVLAVPLLVLVLHWPLSQAAPTALMAVGMAAALGAIHGLRLGHVRWRAALVMGCAGMLGAPVGQGLGASLPQGILLWGFAALMLGLAWRQWPRALAVDARRGTLPPPCLVHPLQGRLQWTSPCARAIIATGGLSGVLSGLVGVGGGFVIVPALRRHTDLDVFQIQLTSLAVIALVAVSGVGSAAWQGKVPWDLALPFALGAMLAMSLVRRFAHRIPPRRSDQLFCLSCVLVAALLVVRPG